RAFRRGEQQGVFVSVAEVKTGGIRDPGHRLLAIDNYRGRQETTLRTNLDPVRTRQTDIGIGGREDVRVKLSRSKFCSLESNFAVGAGRRIGNIPLEVEETVVSSVQNSEAISLRVYCGGRIGNTVHNRRIVELLHTD